MSEFSMLKRAAFGDILKVMGEKIIYHFAGGDNLQTCGVFSEVDIELQDGQGIVDSRVLTLTIDRCVFINKRPSQNDRITLDNITYDVRRVVENAQTNYTLYLFEHDTQYDTQHSEQHDAQ
jgi:hypothetical protein